MAPPDPWAPATIAQPLNKPNPEFDEFALLGNRSLQASMLKLNLCLLFSNVYVV